MRTSSFRYQVISGQGSAVRFTNRSTGGSSCWIREYSRHSSTLSANEAETIGLAEGKEGREEMCSYNTHLNAVALEKRRRG